AGIPTWSPTVVLICRSTAYVWQSGRDAQFSADCGRMCLIHEFHQLFYLIFSGAFSTQSPSQKSNAVFSCECEALSYLCVLRIMSSPGVGLQVIKLMIQVSQF
ncbi:hypothetical protein KCU71_g9574, partial [Aureobasidium melanogenum]